MKEEKRLDKLFLYITSIQTVFMGVSFIVQILRIFYGNEAVFTSEICGKYLLEILPIIILWILVIIISYIYFFPNQKSNKNVAKITNITKLNNLEMICPIEDDDSLNEFFLSLKNEKKKRKIAKIITFIILLICSIMGLCYLLNVKHFESSGDLSSQAVKMSIHLLPWVLISFISLIVLTLYEEYSAKKSIETIKMIIKSKGKKKQEYVKEETLVINIARASILVISIVLIVVGIFDGGIDDVLQKAINICTECIGLG